MRRGWRLSQSARTRAAMRWVGSNRRLAGFTSPRSKVRRMDARLSPLGRRDFQRLKRQLLGGIDAGKGRLGIFFLSPDAR